MGTGSRTPKHQNLQLLTPLTGVVSAQKLRTPPAQTESSYMTQSLMYCKLHVDSGYAVLFREKEESSL
jgi:hypothetical protein